ncbi:MAG: 5'-nucleotidase C-terminal domain-containing protein [Woeseiaceae bacterium]|nr:5'-nucleotidase C-terminal domain-containing protein [Woeseiaceae bacterium]
MTLTVLLLVSCTATPVAPSSGLTFFHLNDTYRVGAVEDGKAGGFSRVVTLARKAKAEGRDVRFLHGGDFLYPSLESRLWNGLQMVDAFNFLNAIAPLYAVSGNHEFDRGGASGLAAAVNASEFVWVGDNYEFLTGDARADNALKKAFVFEYDGRRIGLFSLMLHGDHGGARRDFVPIDPDYAGAARRTIERLEAVGVDMIIGVTHLHLWTDVELASLKAENPKLAFIVGGHEHEPQYYEGSSTEAIVMKGASNARQIWRIDVDFDTEGGFTVSERQIAIDESIEFDPDYEALAAKWRGRLLARYPFLEARIGTAAVPLNALEETIRTTETSLGNFIADQMRIAFGEPHANLAFINSGTLRIDDVIEDDIEFEDISRTFGFSSLLRHTTLTGAEFRRVMEAGYRGGPESQGYFPQVSGFRVCVDPSRPDFDRIVSLQVPADDGWQEIDPDQNYTVVVPDFLFGGGDGYEIPKDRFASRPASELKYLVLDAILQAQASGEQVGERVTRDNRRFHRLHEPKERCFAD